MVSRCKVDDSYMGWFKYLHVTKQTNKCFPWKIGTIIVTIAIWCRQVQWHWTLCMASPIIANVYLLRETVVDLDQLIERLRNVEDSLLRLLWVSCSAKRIWWEQCVRSWRSASFQVGELLCSYCSYCVPTRGQCTKLISAKSESSERKCYKYLELEPYLNNKVFNLYETMTKNNLKQYTYL